MAFFDKLGETISTKSKDVAKKAKDLTEIARLSGQVSSKENALEELYCAIGKLYYGQNKDTVNSPFAEQLAAVTAAKEEIDALRKTIAQLKGERTCPACGAPINEETVFCSACGTKIEPVETELPLDKPPVQPGSVCPACGKEVTPENIFCDGCGAKLQEQ